jgi:hypothetical protein
LLLFANPLVQMCSAIADFVVVNRYGRVVVSWSVSCHLLAVSESRLAFNWLSMYPQPLAGDCNANNTGIYDSSTEYS